MGDRIKRGHRFSVVPEHLIRDPRVSDRAFRLWCILDRYAGADESAFPLRKTLAADLGGISTKSVDRALAELVARGWLHKESGKDRGGANTYTLLVAKATKGQGATPVTHPAPSDTDDPPLDTGVAPVDTGVAPPGTPVTQGRDTGVPHKEASPTDASQNGKAGGAAAPPERPDLNGGRDDVDRVCTHLSESLTARQVKHSVSKAWRDAARLMMDADGRTEQQVHNMIEWSAKSAFWSGNVHSMPTLREKYDKMKAQALRDRGAAPATVHHATDPAHSAQIADRFTERPPEAR